LAINSSALSKRALIVGKPRQSGGMDEAKAESVMAKAYRQAVSGRYRHGVIDRRNA
jgi:hypothetical protein